MADRGERTLASLATRILEVESIIESEQPPPLTKFRTITVDDEQLLVEGQKNINTKKKTELDVELLMNGLQNKKSELQQSSPMMWRIP